MNFVASDVFVDFGEPAITIVDDNGNELVTFQNTRDLEDLGLGHHLSLFVGPWQDGFNMLEMVGGEDRNDINFYFNLFLHFPDRKHPVPLVVKLFPDGHDRACPGSSQVRVICTGTDEAGQANAWRVETREAPENIACISQKAFGEPTHGRRPLTFGFTVTR